MASPDERDEPLGVVKQIARRAVSVAQNARRVAPALSSAHTGDLGVPAVAGGGRRLPVATVHELAHDLLALADDQPLLVTVDDVQHADVESLAWLRFVVDELGHHGAMVLLAESSSGPLAHPLFHADLLRSAACVRVHLGALTCDGVARLVAAELGPAAGDLAPEYHRLTGGNLRLVRALVDDAHVASVGTAGTAGGPVVGDAYRQAILACLERYRPPIGAVAGAAAVLASSGSLGPGAVMALRRLVDADVAAVRSALEHLRDTGVLGADWNFRHPAAGAALLEAMGPARRRHLHLHAAGLLRLAGASQTVVAAHLVAAGDAPAAWGFDTLVQAAEDAVEAGDAEAAAVHLDLANRAGAAGGDARRRAQVTGVRARLAAAADPGGSTAHLDALLEAYRRREVHDHDAATLLLDLARCGRVDDAAEVIRLSAEGWMPGNGVQFDVSCRHVANAYPPLWATVAWAEERLPPERRAALAANRRAQLAAALRAVLGGGPSGAAAGMALEAVRTTPLGDVTVGAVEAALLALMYAGRLDEAGSWCDALLAEATVRGAARWQAVMAAVAAEVARRRGDLPAAGRRAATVLTLLPQGASPAVAGAARATLALSALGGGRPESAAECFAEPVPDALFRSRAGLVYLYARARYRLGVGHIEAARADIDLCGTYVRDWKVDSPTFVPWRSVAARLHAAVGDTARAERLIGDELDLAGSDAPRARGVALLALAEVRDGDRRVADLHRAADALHDAGDRALLGIAIRQLGPSSRWAGALDGVAPPGVAHAGPVLRQPALTASERRVAELAATGRRNREISRELYVTISTVEQHLTRVYRKLGVRSRHDLRAALVADLETST